MVYSEVLSDDDVEKAIQQCRVYIQKVTQLKWAAYGANLICNEFVQCEKNICETPEVKGVNAILCLLYEGLLTIMKTIESDLNFV